MKTIWIMTLVMLVAIRSQSQDDPERLLSGFLRQNATNQVDMANVSTRLKNADRKVAFALGLRDDDESRVALKAGLATNANPWARFYCAVALAAQKDTNAIPVLQGVFTGKTPIQSSSCFELSVAGLALIVLGVDPPESFSFKTVPNPLFPQLEATRNKSSGKITEPPN